MDGGAAGIRGACVRSDSVGTFIDLQCAGHDQSNPLYYDQNGDDWSGRVLVILEEGIGLHQVEFQVWEDDYQACAWNAGRPPHTTDHTANDIKNLAAKIFQAYIDTGVKQIASILMVVPGCSTWDLPLTTTTRSAW